MNKFARLSAGLTATLIALLPAAPAQAQNAVSFVSSAGSGTTCTRAAPCHSFQTAHDATNIGGLINCLDSGPFSGASIVRSITINCEGTAATATTAFIIHGAGIVVTIRNLSMSGTNNTTGIDFQNGASLIVENCIIQNITASPGIGINFDTSDPGSQLVVTDTILSDKGSGSIGGGIVVHPQQSVGSAVISLDRVTVANNVFGIVADGSSSTAGINMTIRNSAVHRNTQDGIVATTVSSQAPIGILIKNTASLSNNIGIRATGPGVTVRADSASVSGNGTGLVVNNGATLLSFGNNNVEANGVNGAFSGPVTLK